MRRREFLSNAAARIARWSPALALLGFRFHPYTNAVTRQFWLGWVTWAGRTVGFIRSNGDFFWFLGR